MKTVPEPQKIVSMQMLHVPRLTWNSACGPAQNSTQERVAFAKFSEYCDTTRSDTKKAIVTGGEAIVQQTAAIGKALSDAESLAEDIKESQSEVARMEQDWKCMESSKQALNIVDRISQATPCEKYIGLARCMVLLFFTGFQVLGLVPFDSLQKSVLF